MKLPTLLFATERYEELGEDIAGTGDFELGVVERKVFPDDERYRRIETDCASRDVVLVGGTVDDVDTLEIYDLACGLVHLGAHTLTLVLPWFGYQTMERASKRGEIVAAKNRARLLSSIPAAGSGNRAVLIDLHSEGIPHYFSGNIRPVHLHARSVVLQAIRDFGGEDFILGATDAGRAKWVESLANDLLVDAAFVFKRRLSDTQTEITALAAEVEDRPVVIYDDMIRTGGSLISAATAYRDAGASEVYAVCTHGVFTHDSLETIQNSGMLEGIACTNTRPHVQALADGDYLRVYSVADLIAQFLADSV
jgi:ribose-phosphate pyrophosphokinase